MLGKRRMHHVIKLEITSQSWKIIEHVTNVVDKANKFGGILLESEFPELKKGEKLGTVIRIAFRTKIQIVLFEFFAEDSIRQLK